jgi:hypothetical protein
VVKLEELNYVPKNDDGHEFGCLSGAMACPPEDISGGIEEYKLLMAEKDDSGAKVGGKISHLDDDDDDDDYFDDDDDNDDGDYDDDEDDDYDDNEWLEDFDPKEFNLDDCNAEIREVKKMIKKS